MSCDTDAAWIPLLWLWHRPVATALIGPLAWEAPCAMGLALKRQKDIHTKKQEFDDQK